MQAVADMPARKLCIQAGRRPAGAWLSPRGARACPPHARRCREKGQKCVQQDVALAVWQLLVPPARWPLMPDWCQFLAERHNRAISRDTWAQLLDFMQVGGPATCQLRLTGRVPGHALARAVRVARRHSMPAPRPAGRSFDATLEGIRLQGGAPTVGPVALPGCRRMSAPTSPTTTMLGPGPT
jgi:hypothetical protein